MRNLVEAPSNVSVLDAITCLVQFGAIRGPFNELTPMGKYMSMIPLHPQLAKMLVLSCIFKCLEPVLSIVAVLSEKDPFLLGYVADGTRAEIKQRFSKGVESDHLMYANVIAQFEKAYKEYKVNDFTTKNHLNEKALVEICNVKVHLKTVLKTIQIITKKEEYYNENAENLSLIKGVIASALHPYVRPLLVDRKSFPFLTDHEDNNSRYATICNKLGIILIILVIVIISCFNFSFQSLLQQEIDRI